MVNNLVKLVEHGLKTKFNEHTYANKESELDFNIMPPLMCLNDSKNVAYKYTLRGIGNFNFAFRM
jgi:hypothetical protein